MKKLAILCLCLLSINMCLGDTFYYPNQEKALYTIQVPDSWKPEVLEDGSLEAWSPDEKGYMNTWVLKNKEDFDSLKDDINELIEPWLKDVKLGDEPEKITSAKGTEFQVYSGSGKDKEDGSAQGFEIFLFEVTEGQVGVFFVQYADEAPKGTVEALIEIAKSIAISK